MDTVLTDQDKERILQEEKYRHEVKEQLAKENGGNKRRKSVWTFLNSPFFLWFLSSVVLAGISYYYTSRDERNTLAREQREKGALAERDNKLMIRKLDAEISSRFMYFVNSIQFKNTPDKIGFTFVHESATVKNAVQGIEDPTTTGYKVNVFPEYADRSLRSLLLDLQNVVPDKEKPEIDLACKEARLLQSVYLRAKQIEEEQDGEKIRLLEDQQYVDLSELNKAFNLKRWGEPFDNGTNSVFFMREPAGPSVSIRVPKK